MEDLFKALGIFQQGVQEAAISKGIADATEAVSQIQSRTDLETEQKIQAQKLVTNRLMASLSGAGASASRIQSAAAGLMPELPQNSKDAFALAQQTGDQYYMKMAKDMQSFENAEQRNREAFDASEAEKQRAFLMRMKAVEQGKGGAKLSPLDEAVDQENAKRLIDYKPEAFASGFTLMDQARTELASIQNDMLSGGIPGRIAGALPGTVTSRIGSTVQAAVQDQLRPIYGSQFTEKEGERFFRSIFDPADPTGSLQRMDIFMKRMDMADKTMRSMREYAQQYGTTKGFQSPDGYELLKEMQKLKVSTRGGKQDGGMIDVKGAAGGKRQSTTSAPSQAVDPMLQQKAREILKKRREGM
jgi:hypothetical protein